MKKDTQEEIADDYRWGDSIRALQSRYGASRHAVVKSLVANGLTVKERKARRNKKIVALYQGGLSIAAVARKLDLDYQVAWMAIHNSGIEKRQPPGTPCLRLVMDALTDVPQTPKELRQKVDLCRRQMADTLIKAAGRGKIKKILVSERPKRYAYRLLTPEELADWLTN